MQNNHIPVLCNQTHWRVHKISTNHLSLAKHWDKYKNCVFICRLSIDPKKIYNYQKLVMFENTRLTVRVYSVKSRILF